LCRGVLSHVLFDDNDASDGPGDLPFIVTGALAAMVAVTMVRLRENRQEENARINGAELPSWKGTPSLNLIRFSISGTPVGKILSSRSFGD